MQERKPKKWTAKWTLGRCGSCNQRKYIFATHGKLHSIYPHICKQCYLKVKEQPA